jgi:outer membrane immunogenic protein
MKRVLLALTAVAAFTGSALAADLPARTYSKAPAVVAAAPSWTGCYVGGGGGYGLYNQETTEYLAGPPRVQTANTWTNGGRGYFGTVQGGCDYQFGLGGYNLLVGAFGDYDFSSISGRFGNTGGGRTGDEKLSSSWSIGGRAGWIVLPGLLTYFSAGYTEAKFDSFNLALFGAPADSFFASHTYKGYFIGAGDEYAVSFLPGLFWKTEYRFSTFDTATNPSLLLPTGLPSAFNYDMKKYEQSVRSELVYRFNWGGPVVAKY